MLTTSLQSAPKPALSPSSQSFSNTCQDWNVTEVLLDLPDRYNVAADLLSRNLPARASKVAIHTDQGGTTYAQVARLANGAARKFLEMGVRREERVLICGFD